MDQKDQLDLLLKRAATQTPSGDQEHTWLRIREGLTRPGEQRVPFRQLRILGIAALLLIICNIWLCSGAPADNRSKSPARISYDLNIY